MPPPSGWEQELSIQILSPSPIQRVISLSAHCIFRLKLIDAVPPASLSAASACPGTMCIHCQSPWCCSEHIAPKVPSNFLVLVRVVSATGSCSPSPGQGLLVTQEPTRLTEQPGFKNQGYCVPPVPNESSCQAEQRRCDPSDTASKAAACRPT